MYIRLVKHDLRSHVLVQYRVFHFNKNVIGTFVQKCGTFVQKCLSLNFQSISCNLFFNKSSHFVHTLPFSPLFCFLLSFLFHSYPLESGPVLFFILFTVGCKVGAHVTLLFFVRSFVSHAGQRHCFWLNIRLMLRVQFFLFCLQKKTNEQSNPKITTN